MLAEKIRQQVPQVVLTPPQLSPQELAAIVAGSQMTVAMRLHALIFAYAAGVPVLALAYDPKVTALADQGGQPGIDALQSAPGQAWLDAFAQAWQERHQAAERLQLRWPGIRASAHQGMEAMLREIAPTGGGQDVS